MKIKRDAAWMYGSKNFGEVAEKYDGWAEAYDRDLYKEYGYVGPARTVAIFAKYVAPEARVLDAGAGTGLAGELLWKRGYRHMTGIDISEGMLEQARKKGIYTEVRRETLGEALGFADKAFDAVISVGVFAPAQGPPTAFEELIRITKPGGYIAYTLRTDFYRSSDFKPTQAALEAARRWELVERTAKFQGLPKAEPDLFYRIWVYRVC